MNYYPIHIPIKDKKVLIIGGGRVALRKAKELLLCDANVTVVSLHFVEEFKSLLSLYNNLSLIKKQFIEEDIEGSFLVFACTNNDKINSEISDYCSNNDILVNSATTITEDNFIVPSILRKGSLTVGISTDGISPLLSKKIKHLFNDVLPEKIDNILILLKKLRLHLLNNEPWCDYSSDERKIIFETVLDDLLSNANVNMENLEDIDRYLEGVIKNK